ncbi:sporulation protein [Nocardiopsis halophila]|uniref:sporulation protein n=1 Tax=Nocardiopsis halophila TaxID=141692 RepID=UPI0003458A68|nr:sporulation protein [Nocardiopsis halophila]
MEFKRLLAGLGFGGAAVRTVLREGEVRPGGVLAGTVHVEGGEVDLHIDEVTVGLQARAEMDKGEVEWDIELQLKHERVKDALELGSGARVDVPFELALPWETPLTRFRGRAIPGMGVGLYTQLHVSAAVDPEDLDPVAVAPLASQAAVLEAAEEAGLPVRRARLERGLVPGMEQRLPFYQQLCLGSAERGVDVDMVFVTGERSCRVAAERADGRGQAWRGAVDHDDPAPGVSGLTAWLEAAARS